MRSRFTGAGGRRAGSALAGAALISSVLVLSACSGDSRSGDGTSSATDGVLGATATSVSPQGSPSEVISSATSATAPASSGAGSGAGSAAGAAAGSVSVPEPMRGEWSTEKAQCGAPSEGRLIVGDSTLQFYEASGTVRSVTSNGSTYTMQLVLSGEGETRTETWQWVLSSDGNRLIDMATGTVRVRC